MTGSERPKKALVLGGTGHIGSAIARRLVAAGWQVTATGRRDIARPNLGGSGAEIVSGDDCDPDQVAHWVDGMALVVDAATPYPINLHGRETREARARACARVAFLLEQSRRRSARFVQISSFTTLPPPPGVTSQLTHGLVQGIHPYFTLKRQVQGIVLRAIDAGQDACVINPTAVIGPYDMKPRNQAFVPLLLSGQVHGMVRKMLNVVDVRDLAEVVCAAALADKAPRQVPVFGHSINLTDLCARICELGGVAPPRLAVPAPFGLAGLYWIETLLALGGSKSPYPSLPMMLVASSYAAAPSATQRALHPTIRPLDSSLTDAIDWYRRIGYA